MLAILATAGFIGLTYAGTVALLRLSRKPIDNSPHNIAESDPYLAFVARDAEISRALSAVRGSGCECGPFHTSAFTTGMKQDHER